MKLGLGFTEEMAQELRNSTEELDFQDPTDIEVKQRRRKLHQQQAVSTYLLCLSKSLICATVTLLSVTGYDIHSGTD